MTRFRLLLLDTRLGRLDVLGQVEPLGGFEDLEWIEVDYQGSKLRVLSLDALIRVKAHLRRPKDKIVEAELKAIRARLRSGPSE